MGSEFEESRGADKAGQQAEYDFSSQVTDWRFGSELLVGRLLFCGM